MPDPSMISVIAALSLAELETEHPGFIDRIIARLSSDALRSQVISLRGERAAPAVIDAQKAAFVWLSALAPLLRAAEAPKKRRRRT